MSAIKLKLDTFKHSDYINILEAFKFISISMLMNLKYFTELTRTRD